MKRIILILILCICLSGCTLYNLTNYTTNDEEFLAVIKSLNTPEKICTYMEENFEWQLHWLSYSPYQMWFANVKTRAGDCNDMSCFAVFVANYHGYETYQIRINYEGTSIGHFLGVFVEDGYTYSSNSNYYPIQVNTFREILRHHINIWGVKLNNYRVYDYFGKIIEVGK